MAFPKMKTPSEVTVIGVVTAAEWDDDDNVTAVYLNTDDDESYFVEPNREGRKLLTQLDHLVEARGRVHDHDGELVLAITGFDMLDEDELGADDFEDGDFADDDFDERER